ncbi:MAG: hypothetical protein RIT43_1977 [Bacteroidota bacterium]|jgi:hypothetical protein
MRILALLSLFFLLHVNVLAQGEEVGPLTRNTDILVNKKISVKSGNQTFDSTFIYVSDTLQLPLFDEFTVNHFQEYSNDYSAAGVTSDKKYRILDNVTLQPVDNQLRLTGQATFRRTYDLVSSTFIDETFSSTSYQVGELTSYPVVYATTELFPPYYIYDTIGAPDVSDTVWITDPEFYQDSATQFFMPLSDPNAFWLEQRAYHNYRFAVNPRSLGVVTFDGLDADGYPYAIGTSSTSWADVLTSKPLDLSPYNAGDSVYFSFLYQAEGLGDVPEPSDSLILEFYAKDLDQWFRVWGDSGQVTSEFKVGHIRLSEAKYFKKGFQFRFRNYGALSGSLDHFHLDYVHLRTLSGYQDTLFKDFAFSYPVGSLLKTYTSVPWDHFKNNAAGKMNDQLEITVHNGSNLTENNQNGSVQVSYSGVPEGNFTLTAQTLSGGNINYGPRTTYTSYHDLSGGYIFDVTKPGLQQEFDILASASAQFPNLAINDVSENSQVFSNYYSYDDGTAEAAYGPTGSQARLAMKYAAYEEDSLLGLKIHFVPSVNDVSGNLFLITVWSSNGGLPGSVLYEDDVFFPRNPVYSNDRNGFVNYYFKDTLKVAVGTEFFVGWRQFDPERLNVGLDRNLDNSDKTYYSVDNGISWNQSLLPGSVMVRPIFSTSLDPTLDIPEDRREARLEIFPNPSNDIVTIRGFEGKFSGAQLYSLTGSLILKLEESVFSVSGIHPGMYILKMTGSSQIHRLIIK